MTLLRELIRIPDAVGEADFVVRASERADLANYVVTDQVAQAFEEALTVIRHSLTDNRSQAKFLHGSFGSGKSHFMAVLRELLAGNPDARAIKGLGRAALHTEAWLPGKKILTLSMHMLDADSVEQAIFTAYLEHCRQHHGDAPPPAVHRSDALLQDATTLRHTMGDELFFSQLRSSGVVPGGQPNGLAAYRAANAGWTPETYSDAAGQSPGTQERDALVSALTVSFFSASVRSGEFLDLDTGLAVVTRHAQSLGYNAIVLFLDEFILWLSTKITDTLFVNTEGAKLNKLVESSDGARPLPMVSFVAQQRLLTEFFGDQVAGTDRETIANIMTSAQGRLGTISLADTNLPAIAEGRILQPVNDTARKTISDAFDAVRDNRDVWDILLLGAQYNDAGIGSDASSFRRLYPFSPALVATLVALSQALQRQRTALKIMTELLVARRETLRVNDLIGVAALFDPLVLTGELPERPELKQKFQAARATYKKLRGLMLEQHRLSETEAATHQQFGIDDALIRTVLLGALVPDVPALHNLTALKLHALNFGSITAPIPGYEAQVVRERLNKLADLAGELQISKDPDPVISAKLTTVDYDKLIELAPSSEESTGAVQRLIRDLISDEMGLGSRDTLDDIVLSRAWRGRNHTIQLKFGNVRDAVTMPDSAILSNGQTWRIVIDYPMDEPGFTRRDDNDRIQRLKSAGVKSRTVFWVPLFLTKDVKNKARLLSKINYLVGTAATGRRLDSVASDWSASDREQGRIYLQQRQQQLQESLVSALRQAYGVSKAGSDVDTDGIAILHTLADGVRLPTPQGGTLETAFQALTGQLLAEAYPGTPHLPDEEKPLTKGELAKVLHFATQATLNSAKAVSVPVTADQNVLRRICNRLGLGNIVENRYALNLRTCTWSTELTRLAAADGHTMELHVDMLRALMEQEGQHYGFERDLQNLIIMVVALEQQLAWFNGDTQIEVESVTEVSDRYKLKRPDMPSKEEWQDANQRSEAIFGLPLPVNLVPAIVKLMAGDLRTKARALRPHTTALLAQLEKHAGVLGLDLTSYSGRFATARRCDRLLHDLATPDLDDANVIRALARADLGNVDLQAIGVAAQQAKEMAEGLASIHWNLLELAQSRIEEPEFSAICGRFRGAATRDELELKLVPALRQAQQEIATLLGSAPVRIAEPAATEVVPDSGSDSQLGDGGSREINDIAELEEAVSEIRQAVLDGKKVKLSWEIR